MTTDVEHQSLLALVRTDFDAKLREDQAKADRSKIRPELISAFEARVAELGPTNGKAFKFHDDLHEGHATFIEAGSYDEVNYDLLAKVVPEEVWAQICTMRPDKDKVEAAIKMGIITSAQVRASVEKKSRAAYVKYTMVTRVQRAKERLTPAARRVARAR